MIYLRIILIPLLFSACNQTDWIELKPASKNDVELFSRMFDIDTSQINQAIELGLFEPENKGCFQKIQLLESPAKIKIKDIKACKSESKIETVKNLLGLLYTLFGDPSIPQNEGFDYNISLDNILDSLYLGQWAPQCGGISSLSKKIIDELNIELNIDIVQTENSVIHTLNKIEFEENNLKYLLFVDFQNGFIFPYNKEKDVFISKTSLVEERQYADFFTLPKEILYKKRNFLNEPLPCNFMIQEYEQYYNTPKSSPYKYIRATKAFHLYLWFDKKKIDINNLKEELLEKLLD